MVSLMTRPDYQDITSSWCPYLLMTLGDSPEKLIYVRTACSESVSWLAKARQARTFTTLCLRHWWQFEFRHARRNCRIGELADQSSIVGEMFIRCPNGRL
jgi:hypothetical protein